MKYYAIIHIDNREENSFRGVIRISLTKYQLLISAIEKGTLSAAAEEMNYTQSGVSHMINSLEEEIGVKLVVRSRTGIKLTSSGEILIPYIRQILNHEQNFRQALSEITGILSGKLTIGTFTTISAFYLPEIISRFRKQYPNIVFELKPGTYEQIEHWLESREIDCGFVSLPTKDSFEILPVYKDRLVVAAGKEFHHNFKNTKSVTIKELEETEHILIDGITDYDQIRIFKKDINKLKVRIITGDSYSAIKMIENNMGIGVIPYNMAGQFQETLNIFEMEETFYRTLAFAYINKSEASPVLKHFISFLEHENNVSE